MNALELRRLMKQPERFEAWLLASDATFCGDSESPAGCPLARWLSDEAGEPVKVYRDRTELRGRTIKWFPQWMADFTDSVDLHRKGQPVPTVGAVRLIRALFGPIHAFARILPPPLMALAIQGIAPKAYEQARQEVAAYEWKR